MLSIVHSHQKRTRALTLENYFCFWLGLSVLWLAQCLIAASTIGKWGGGGRGGGGGVGKSAGLGLAGLGCTDPRNPGTDPEKYVLALPHGLMADARQLVDPRQLALPAMPSMLSVCSSSRFREREKEKENERKPIASASWMPSTPGGGAWSLPLLNFGFSSTSLLTGLHLLSPSPRAPSGTPVCCVLWCSHCL